MTTDFLRNTRNRLLKIWTLFVFSVLNLTMLSCTNKQTNYNLISRTDSVQVIQKILTDRPMANRLNNESIGEQLKLVIGKNVHSNSKLFFNNKSVSIVSYDSTTDEIRAKFPRKFFGQVPMFNVLPDGNVKLSIVFRGSGLTGLYVLKRDKANWVVINRQFGRM